MKEKIRLVQLGHPELGRKLALVQEPALLFLNKFNSVYDLAVKAVTSGKDIVKLIQENLTGNSIPYDIAYNGLKGWKLLPSFDCPSNPYSCLVSGTGLTHKNSALNRQMMHQAEENKLTDSMKIYQWGLEGGQPSPGMIGTQPEWFYKGTGAILRGHGAALTIPSFGDDGGEEPEIAGVYIVDEKGRPFRIGFTTSNEFSDHVMERKNYLYLAPSKLRNCSIGPELVIDNDFADIQGMVSVSRNGMPVWSSSINTGEKNMAHSLGNLEYHHFKYPEHRQPLQSHVHFFGADAFSFGSKIKLEAGDEMQVHWEGMGRPLKNHLVIETNEEEYIAVKSIQNQASEFATK